MTAPAAGTLLIIDADAAVVASFKDAFFEAAMKSVGANDLSTALEQMKKYRPDTVVFNPLTLKSDVRHLIKFSKTYASNLHRMQFFAICHLPYAAECQKAADVPGVKVITSMMPMADIVKTVRLHMSASEARINYEHGLLKMIYESLHDLLSHYMQPKLIVHKPALKKSDQVPGDVLAVIAISGAKLIGTLALSFDKAFTSELAGAMLGEPSAAANLSEHEIIEVVGEALNQLAGILQSKIGKSGLSVNIGLPRLVAGSQTRFIHPGRNLVVSIGLGLEGDKGFLDKVFSNAKPKSSIEFCFDAIG